MPPDADFNDLRALLRERDTVYEKITIKPATNIAKRIEKQLKNNKGVNRHSKLQSELEDGEILSSPQRHPHRPTLIPLQHHHALGPSRRTRRPPRAVSHKKKNTHITADSFDVVSPDPLLSATSHSLDDDSEEVLEELEDEPRSAVEYDIFDDLGDMEDMKDTKDAKDTTDVNVRRLTCLPVNGRPSCQFHVECTLHPKPESSYCFYHHRVVARRSLSDVLLVHRRARLFQSEKMYQPNATFVKPGPKILNTLRRLHHVHNSRVMWAVDCEFGTIKSANAIPYSICIRDMKSGEIILYAKVDWGKSLDRLYEVILQHCNMYLDADQLPPFLTRNHFAKFYKSDYTNGLSPRTFGQAMREKGWNIKTYCLLSGYCSLDGAIVGKALRGDN